jgi:hypothetical protein
VAASLIDIKSAKQTYIDLFGQMPPLPKTKFEFLEDIDTAFLGRAGATWEELAHVVELVAAVQVLGPSNQGGAMLSKMRAAETTTD